jgi:hypothetical protein
MVDLPSVPNVVPEVRAPESRISPGQIAQPYQELAANLDKGAGVLNDAAVAIAKNAGLKAVTRDADGNVQVEHPPLIGDAAIAFHQAVKVAAVADGEGDAKRRDIAMREQFRDDPDGYAKASEAYKNQIVQTYTDKAGPDVGIAMGKIVDGQSTLTYRGLLNEHEKLTLQRADASITTGIASATDDLTAMARGGVTSGPAWEAASSKVAALTQQKVNNPRLAYPPEQAAFDTEQLTSNLKAQGFLYHIDQVYKDPEQGAKGALEQAKGILTDTSLKLSEPQREQFYHKAVGEIRANEAIRKQDLGDARASFNELSLASAAGARITPDAVENVASGFRAAGDPGGAARVYASFLRKPLNDDFGRQPLADQTKQLTALQGAEAAKSAHAFFTSRGYTPEQSAGIVGNLVHESGMQPGAVGDSGTSGGLAQFHDERLTALKSYAASQGKPATDFKTQLEFIDKELNSTEAPTRAKLMAARTPEDAAKAFIDYERPQGWTPQNPAGGLGYQSRVNFARQVFNGQPGDTSMGPAGTAWLAANRKSAVDDAATAQWKTVMTDYTKDGTRPSQKAVNDIVVAARATGNTALLDTIGADADRMDLSGQFSKSSLPDQHAALTQMEAAGQAGQLSPGSAQTMKDLERRNQVITKGLDDNPIATAVTNFPDKLKPPAPLDFSSDQALAAGLKTRGQIAAFASQNWQVPPVAALDAADVQQMQAQLGSPDPAVKGKIFNALSQLPEETRNATLAKIGAGKPELMVSVAAGSMMHTAPDVASSIIQGQAAIAMDKGYLPTKGSEAAAFDTEFDKHIPASTFSLAARTDASGPYAVAQGMVKARYAFLSAQSNGDTSGKFNADRLAQSVNDVTGGVLDHNGGKLIAPVRGMPQGVFDKTMAGITDADLGHITQPAGNLAAADAAMNLTPQERDLYQRHLSNLYGTGGVTHEDGSRSTLFQTTVEHAGKFYTIPTVFDGKVLWDKGAADPAGAAVEKVKQIGWDKFPSYGSEAEAESRYQKMHDFIAKDTAEYNKGNPQAVTTLGGEKVDANYLRNNATLESVGDGRYYVKLGKDQMKPVYAYQGANTETPQKFMLDLRNRPLGVVAPSAPLVQP